MYSKIFAISLVLISLSVTTAFAKESFKQETLADGSKKMVFSSADGSQMIQIQKPDGTTEVRSIDAQGNETTSVQNKG